MRKNNKCDNKWKKKLIFTDKKVVIYTIKTSEQSAKLLPKGALLFQPQKIGSIRLQNSYFSSVFLPIFPVSQNIPKTRIVFVAAAGGCLVEEKEWYNLLGKEGIVFRSVYTLNPFMSWLILQNDSQFPGLGKAGSVLCKIGRGKSDYHYIMHCCILSLKG